VCWICNNNKQEKTKSNENIFIDIRTFNI